MKQLNFNHLHYFYVVAKEGGIHRASEKLHITPQTISGQITSMEKYLGFTLFDRVDKRLILNEMGTIALRYAEDIFSLGDELAYVFSSGETQGDLPFSVGILDSVPKIFAYDLLRQSFKLGPAVKLNAREGDFDSLLSEFALNKLDLIISDRPIPPRLGVKGSSHIMSESGFTFFAAKSIEFDPTTRFPQCLNGVPLLLPGDKSLQKGLVMSWLSGQDVTPKVVAEFDDTALMKLFGQEGHGVFFTPTTIENFVLEQFTVEVIGRVNDVKDQFYAILPERKVAHPAAALVLNEARLISLEAAKKPPL